MNERFYINGLTVPVIVANELDMIDTAKQMYCEAIKRDDHSSAQRAFENIIRAEQIYLNRKGNKKKINITI